MAVRERSAELAEGEARLSELRDEIAAERELLATVSEQLELRRRDLERTANLKRTGQTSEKAHDDAALAVNATIQTRLERRQAIGRLSARISQQEAVIARNRAALERAERDLSDTEISAPFTGYASDVEAAIGKRLAVGESVARLIDASSLEVRFELPNADYARLVSSGDGRTPEPQSGLEGLPVEVIWRVGERAFSYTGEVKRTDAEIDPATGGIGLYAVISTNGADSVLRPGAFVEVLVPDVRYEQVIAVPESAVFGEDIVYIVENDRLAVRQVEIVREFGDQVYIRGDLAEGAIIVARQFPNIGAGLKVHSLQGGQL
jgi:RND family efflux transporter MFP subunit